MRTYEKTHPWIDFQLDLAKAPSSFWHLLGVAKAKVEQIRSSFLPPGTTRELKKVHLVRGAAATTAIEGNTLSIDEVRKILDDDSIADQPSTKQYLRLEVRNVLDLYNAIVNRVMEDDLSRLTLDTILSYNKQLLADLPREENTSPPGVLRSHPVTVARYLGAPPEDLKFLLNHLCEWLENYFEPLRRYGNIEYGMVRAILAHLYIAWIHPFADGNGRSARALEFQILLAAGVPDVAAHSLSNHYNLTRAEYYRQLTRSSQKSDVFPFLEYALQGFVEALDQTLDEIAATQTIIHWEHFVYDQFSEKQGIPGKRQRQIVLDLSRNVKPGEYLPIAEIPLLTPQLASEYGGKPRGNLRKMLRRDINDLKQMGLRYEVGLPGLGLEDSTGLIEETSDGIRARIELISAFLPRTRQQ